MLDIAAMPALEGHTANVVGDYLVVYGGKPDPLTLNGDAFALNLSTNSWNRLLVSGEAPIPRAYHTAVRHHRSLYVFGGLVSIGVDDIHHNTYNMFANVDALPKDVLAKPGSERFKDQTETRYVTQQRLESNTTHCLQLGDTCSWAPVVAHGVVPPTRAHHAACIYNDTMFVFGGYSCHVSGRPTDEEFKALHHVYGLHLETRTWTAYECTESPPKLYGMSSCRYGPCWLLHGGVDIAQRCETNDTWIFHLERGSWRRVAQAVVPPLAFASAAAFGDTMYLLGGSSDRATRFSPHMYCFDLLKGYWWRKTVPQGEGPPPHCKATLTVDGKRLLAVGGLMTNFRRIESVQSFSIQDGLWEEVGTRFDAPLLDNIRGMENRAEAGPRPIILGAAPRVLKVSQGAQAGNGQTDADDHAPMIMMSSRAAGSPLGESSHRRAADRMHGSASAEVWGNTADNDVLFGMSSALDRQRNNLKHLDDRVSAAIMSRGDGVVGSPAPRGGQASIVEREVEARFQRLKDLTTAGPAAQERVHEYWSAELSQLHVEHQRWREAALVDRDTIRRAITVVDDDAIPRRPSRFVSSPLPEGASPHSSMLGAANIQPLMKAGYVSPSITRLGLTGELERRRRQ